MLPTYKIRHSVYLSDYLKFSASLKHLNTKYKDLFPGKYIDILTYVAK